MIVKETFIPNKNKKFSYLNFVIKILLFAYFSYKWGSAWIYGIDGDRWYAQLFMKWLAGITLFIVLMSIIDDFRKLFFPKKEGELGLSIDEKGITDNVFDEENMGFIAWEDIERVRVKNNFLESTKILLMVKNPMDYINKAKNWKTKKQMKINYRKLETPIVINIEPLSIYKNDLVSMLRNILASKTIGSRELTVGNTR